MYKDTIKLVDGTKKDVKLRPIGLRLAKQLKSKYLKVEKIVPEGKKGIKSMEGVFDFEMLSYDVIEEALKDEGLDMDKVDTLDADRIYNTYYSRIFNPQTNEELEKK